MTEPLPPDRPLDVLVVQHTHWDREWYHPAARFRQRLVALVDELLAPDALGDGESFLLDGQAVVLDDYLAVRPDRREALAAALASGHLEAGPWYVLADELIPGGEALVRNLLVGRRALAALGAEPPPVLYSPDAFGHAAALPAIAAGFGYRLVVAWRGYGGARWPDGDAAWWRGPGGEAALLFHLPRDGYEYGSALPTGDAEAAERWGRMRAELAPRARLGVALVQNGADHHARQARWPEALRDLTAAARPDRVRPASLRQFAETALAAADAHPGLPTVRGELRDSYGYTWTLQGTFATRAHQKRRNAHVERLLVRDVEPWLAALRLRPASDGRDDERFALLGAAWRTLLRCHPHDTLCGCSVDAVARAMDVRLDSAAAQGAGLRHDALEALTGHDPATARERRALWRSVAVVRNRAPRPRGGVAEVELLTFVRDVPVGPGSAGAWRRATAPGATPVVRQDAGAGGQRCTVQVLERTLRHERIESPRHYPDDDLVEAARALVYVQPVAAYGTSALLLDPAGHVANASESAVETSPRPVEVSDGTLDNGTLRVSVDGKGRLRLAALALRHAVDDALSFEDVGDAGDLYTHSPLGAPLRTAWCTGVRTVHRGPLRGEIEARYRMRVPAAAEPGDDPLSRPVRRARRHVELPLTVRVSLDAGASFVRVRVEGENLAHDHRLRVLLATGVPRATVVADAALGPVERRPIEVAPEERAVETPPATAPLHRYVALHGDPCSAVVVSDGLAEYEARDDGAVAVTLVRAVGELSRPDLPERPGNAGWPSATPEAQSVGPFVAELALAFLGPRTADVASEIEALADDVLLPLVGETNRAALAVPAPTAGFALEGRGLALGAAKPSEDGAGVALRCVNVTGETVGGAWRIGARVGRAFLARLDETRLDPLPVEEDGEGSRVRFEAAPRATVTIVVLPPPSP